MFGFSKKERVEKAVRNATKLSERLAKLRDPRNGFAPAADVLAAEVHLRAIVAQIQSKSKGLKLSESATLQLQALTQVVNQGKVGTPSGPYRRSNGNGTEARVDNVWNLEKPKLFASMTSNPLYVPHSSPRLQRGFDPLSSPGFNQSKSQASATHSDAAAPADSLEKRAIEANVHLKDLAHMSAQELIKANLAVAYFTALETLLLHMIDKESREYPVDLKRMLDIGLSLKTSDDKVLALQTRVTALHEIIQEQNKSVKPEPVVDSVRRASRMTPGMMRSHTSTTPHNPHNPTL